MNSQPNEGYGLAIKIAKALNTNPSIVSQVFAGKIEFSLEQGNDLAEFLGLSELETEYLLNLIMHLKLLTQRLQRKWLA